MIAPAGARLLTRVEYSRSVQILFNDDFDPTNSFPAEPEVNGFNNNASSHLVNPLLLEELHHAAEQLAKRAEERGYASIANCDPKEPACAPRVALEFAERAFRRPLFAAERSSFEALYDRVVPSLGPEVALKSVIEATLLSPQFLYRVEMLPSDTVPEGATLPLEPYALAARLSYLMTGGPPDVELLQAARDGTLVDNVLLEAQARRLLDTPAARARVHEFHGLWLHTAILPSIARDGAPEGAGASWADSLLHFVDSIFWSQGGVRRLFSDSTLYLDGTLAELYGYPTPDGPGFVAYSAEEPRPGLLGQPGLLALLSLSNQSSPIRRGVFVRDEILCTPVPNPPPQVNNAAPDPDPNLTTRERFKVHTESIGCRSCHELIDPIGFGFEAYDHLGRFRLTEGQHPIDTSGELAYAPDPAQNGSFQDLGGLSQHLARGTTFYSCLTGKWLEFALGRPPNESEVCAAVASVDDVDPETPLSEAVIAVVLSRPFRSAANPPPGVEP